MKRFLVVLFMFAGMSSFAQEGVKVEGNTVTIKETAPIWPGCEESKDKKACFNKMLMQHIKETYKYPKNDKGEYIRGKATVSMEVNEQGKVVIKSIEGKEPKVNEATRKMISQIPVMTPGKRGGKPTSIGYTIPLTF